jgi:dTMP kinase
MAGVMKRGKLITFEGIEGCGKSTQVELAAGWFASKQLPYFTTREPGGTDTGREIRKILLSEKTVSLVPLSEALLYLADRFQHISEVIEPHLSAGEFVLCDRYHDSTVAYQGYARNLSLRLLDRVWKDSEMNIEPDLTILLDLDPQVGLQRSIQKLKKANLDESRFEKETLEFHTRVREGFLTIARFNPHRVTVLDARGKPEEIHEDVVRELTKIVGEEASE